MNRIIAPCLTEIGSNAPISAIVRELDKLKLNSIDNVPWKDYAYKPAVGFQLAHTVDAVCIKFTVSEENAKAVYWENNAPVYKDSCVEFFVSFDQGKNYYNFEFNCAGFCLAEYGAGKPGRINLPEVVLKEIKTRACVLPDHNGTSLVHWSLTAVIPHKVFIFDDLKLLKNITASGNFYKCGDDLPTPHYLCWNNINTESPNFHLPEFFGEIKFE